MSIWEIERKYRIPSGEMAAALLRLLRQARYREDHVHLQRDEYYDTNDNQLARLDYTVRLRVENGNSQIALKGPRKVSGSTYSRIELEFSGCGPEQNRSELQRRGLEARVIVEKRRTQFVGRHATIALDEVAHLGWFCEVEGSSDDNIDEIAAQFGLFGLEEVTQNYTELLREARGYPPDRAFRATFE